MPSGDAMREIKEKARMEGWKAAQVYLKADETDRARQGLKLLLGAAVEQALLSTDMSRDQADLLAEKYRQAIGEEIAQLKLKMTSGKPHLAESDFHLFYQEVYNRVASKLGEN
jgi:biopolymer transport protein ExbB/TolQ